MCEVITSELHLSQTDGFTSSLYPCVHAQYASLQETTSNLENQLSSQRLTWIKELKKPDHITFISN